MKTKMLKIVVLFILIVTAISLVTSGSVYFIHRYLLQNEIAQEYGFWEFSLYILGYGSLPNVDKGMQLFLGIIGVIMICLLSAFLSVELSRRAKDVLVSDNLVVWRNEDNEYFASVLVGNLGKPICYVSLAAQLFDFMVEPFDFEENIPVLVNNQTWRVDAPVIIGSLMYEYLRDKYKGDDVLQLYVLVSFKDIDTAQESIICKEYRLEDVAVVSRSKGFLYSKGSESDEKRIFLNDKKSAVRKQFKVVEGEKDAKKEFIDFICADSFNIDMGGAVPIFNNGNSKAKITHKNDGTSQSMNLKYSFEEDDNSSPLDFIIALIKFHPGQNWELYYDRNFRLEFELSASPGISSVQLEIKDSLKDKRIDKELKLSMGRNKFSYTLRELGGRYNWVDVHELCFTVFRRNTAGVGEITVSDFILTTRN